jgi:hemoglobin-like flavoprotein
MTPAQILLVQSSFQLIAPIRQEASELFYHRLFQLDPSLRPLFGDDIRHQASKLMTALGFVVRGLNRPETILDDVRALARRHRGYGVEERHFAVVGEALLWTLDAGLGHRFSGEVREAWTAAYRMLASVMIDAMRPEGGTAERAASRA